MVNLFFFFTFDHFRYQKGRIFPVHEVILYTAIKKLKEGSLACGKPNATVTDKNVNYKGALNKLLL